MNRRAVLVVDDDPRIRHYIAAVLETAGMRTFQAGNGLEALDLFRIRQSSVDLVITDIRMPIMTGTDLAFSLHAMSPCTPVIFVSGEPAPVENEGFKLASCFLEKPFTPAALLDAVRHCFALIGC